MKICNMKTDLPPDALREIVQGVYPKATGAAVDFIVKSLICGVSFDRMEMKLNLDGNIAPMSRNSFYAKKRLVIAKISENGSDGYGGTEKKRQTTGAD